MHDHFCVALSFKNVAFAQQKCAQFLIVIDFSVEDDLDSAVLVRDGLMASLKIDDRESAKTQSDRSRDVVPVIVRPTMVNSVRHGLHERRRHCLPATKHHFSADSTHILSL